MGKEIKNENLDICRLCGGMCCKKSGCDYSANDFKNCSYDNLVKELEKGDKSIVCFIRFKEDGSSKNTYEPFLYLRVRNQNRGVIDLVSMKTTCSQLLENGCSFDYKHRPCGGKNLKPVKPSEGGCVPLVDPMSIVNTWKPHQKTLKRIVLNFTGMNFDKKIREDVENLFYDILRENFEGVSSIELADLKGFAILLGKAFPEELHAANIRYEKNYSKVLVKKDN